MNTLLTLLTAIAAHVIAYYICKWLDSKFADKD